MGACEPGLVHKNRYGASLSGNLGVYWRNRRNPGLTEMAEFSAALVRMPAQLQQLRGRLEPMLRRWVQATFDAADDQLFALADAAVSNQEQNDWFEVMRHIRLSRRRFEDRLLQRFVHYLAVFADHGQLDVVPDWSTQDWQWLDQVALDAGISVDAREELLAREREFEGRWFGGSGDDHSGKASNPASLSRLCLLFNQVLPCLEIPSGAKEILYKHFYLQLLRHLDELYDADLSRLQSPEAVDDTQKQAALAESNAVTGERLIQALSALRNNSAFEELKKQLAAMPLLPGDRNVVDLIDSLFNVVLQTSGLSDEAAMLLQRLQLPVLALALRDQGFLDQSDHPARRLLNHLVEIAPNSDSLAGLRGLVERIDTEVWSNPLIFETVWNEVHCGEENLSPELGQRIQDAEAARCEAERARAYVEQQIAEVMASVMGSSARSIPDVVVRLLRGPWHKVMLLSYLNQGEQSLLWRQQLHTAKELVWSVSGEFDSSSELIQRLPALLNSLRQGFDSIAHDTFELSGLLRELEAVHLQRMTLSGGSAEPHADGFSAAATENTPSELSAEETDSLLQAGGWYERLDENGHWLRCRLAAVIKSSGLAIFVGAHGGKVAELPVVEVSRAMADGSLKEVEDNKLFDRALESVITGLRTVRH